MVDSHTGQLAVIGADGTGFWAEFPEPVTAIEAGVGHWHGSARVAGGGGFAGASGVAHLWVEGLQEFADALQALLDERESEADLDLDTTQVSITRRHDGVLRVEADLEDPASDSTVSCRFDTTLDNLRQTLDQANWLLAQAPD